MKTLNDFCKDWKDWAKTAETSEDGWQSVFPQWEELMEAAKSVMIKSPKDPDILSDIEFCWSISEETEDLADFAKEHIRDCMNILEFLSVSKFKDVRWQVYSVIWIAGSETEGILRRGLNDPDSYCRRRALLSIARLKPSDSKELALKFINDHDPYMRQASIELLHSIKDIAFIKKAKEQLINDETPHVAEAAKRILVNKK
jgi:HEAT repeat protein